SGERNVAEGAEKCSTQSQSKQPKENNVGLCACRRNSGEDLRTGDETNPHHGTDYSEDERAGTQRIADVDGNQRTERAEYKHCQRHRYKNESKPGMSKDELVTFKK